MEKRLIELFAAIDKKDAGGFISYLTLDARLRFANAEPVTGRDNIYKYISGFFVRINGLRHIIIEVWQENNSVICEGEVTYIRNDESALTLPFVNILRMKGNLISDYRIYIDNSALFK